ncbi:hypothetical protein [Chitinophaga silvatica]|nr:hypothetical protein [Chitinophaga silvatica]
MKKVSPQHLVRIINTAIDKMDLPEEGKIDTPITTTRIAQQTDTLTNIIEKGSTGRIRRKAITLKKKNAKTARAARLLKNVKNLKQKT